jgi:predicted transcriptional regulator
MSQAQQSFTLGAYRPPTIIMSELLMAIRSHERKHTRDSHEGRPTSKRCLMREVNINYSQLIRYLTLLEDNGLIRISENTDGQEIFTTTSRTQEFIELVREIQSLLDAEHPCD